MKGYADDVRGDGWMWNGGWGWGGWILMALAMVAF
jgi:hypothetical protein